VREHARLVATTSNPVKERNVMARRSLPSGPPPTDPPLSLADVDIVLPESTGNDRRVVAGRDVATLLDVVRDTEAVLNPEDIARGLEHIADLLATLAEAVSPPTDGALYAAEQYLRLFVARVDGLRPGADTLAEQYRVVPRRTDSVGEELAPYRAVFPLPGDGCAVAGPTSYSVPGRLQM
jgi:hypothetical protein